MYNNGKVCFGFVSEAVSRYIFFRGDFVFMDSRLKSGCAVRQNLQDGILTIAVSGEIDHHNARTIRSQIDESLYYYRSKNVQLDLSDVTFMDSSGLGLILGRFTLARELGGELKIVDPSENVSKILELAGTGRLIQIENSKIVHLSDDPERSQNEENRPE